MITLFGACPLAGRSRELEQLEAAIKALGDGVGRVVLLEGEPGIGKTTLLGKALESAHDLGVQVFAASAEELDQRRPFGVIVDCLGITAESSEAPRGEIARLLLEEPPPNSRPSLSAEGPGVEFRLVEGLVALIEDLAAHRPVALAIDDLQWCDPSTCLVLHRLGRVVSRVPVLVLCSCRPTPRPPELRQLIESFGRGGTVHIHVGPLGEEAVAALAAATVGARPSTALLGQLASAGGNPLFITELLAALREGDMIHINERGEAEAENIVVPSLRAVVLRRLAALPKEALSLLRLAAVLGSSFGVADLSTFLGRPVVALEEPLRETIEARVLVEGDGVLAFRHELIREALYHDLSDPLRAALHREAARALAQMGTALSKVAEHLMRGSSPGDREAAECLHKAAREVAPRAPGTAVELLTRAVQLAETDNVLRERLLADLAMALAWTGRFAEAEEICRQALHCPQEANSELTFRMCLVQTLIGSGRNVEALQETQAAIGSPSLDSTERVRFRAWESICWLSIGDLTQALEVAESTRREAEPIGDDLTVCICLSTEVTVKHLGGSFAEADALAEQALRRADRSLDRQAHRFPISLFRGWFLMDLDRIEEGQAVLRQGRRVVEELGAKGQLPTYHWASALGHFWSGSWEDAIVEASASQELSADVGMGQGIVFSFALCSIIALHRGDLEGAEKAVTAAEAEFARTGPQYGLEWMMLARSLLLEARSEDEAAFSVLCNAWDLFAGMGAVSVLPRLGPDLVRLALARDLRRRAEEVTAAIEAVASKVDVATLSGAALRCRGLLEADATTILAAVTQYRQGPRPLDLALACEDAGHCLASGGDRSEGRRLLTEALSIYEHLGASRDVGRVRSRLRTLGLGRGSRGRRSRPKVGWEALTPTELQVANLVTQGLSNPQIAERMFISRRTVAAHVSGALTKLGANSRVALAAETLRRRNGPPARSA